VLEAKKKQTSTACKDKSSAQIVRNGTAITMQLTLALAAYLVGVLHTILKTRTIDPEFEEDAIAFYQDALGIFPCSIVKRQLKANGPSYRVMTSSGLCVDKRPDELLTGWEPDFPEWSEVQWGRWINWTAEDVADELPDKEVEMGWDRWECDDSYYSDLAEEWESKPKTLEPENFEQLEFQLL